MKQLLTAIADAGHSARLQVAAQPQSIDNEKGAYLLLMHLVDPVSVSIPKTAAIELEPGWFVHASSAKGPGGLRSRLRHHFRRTKKSHWHVDRMGLSDGV